MIFTFQYGATATDYIESICEVSSKFTFQYGATATKYKEKNLLHYFYLHSNMELLLL